MQLEIIQKLVRNIKWLHADKCWNVILNSGLWLGSHLCNTTSICLLAWQYAHTHLMWTWVDTHCKKYQYGYMTHQNVNISKVCRNVKCKQCMHPQWQGFMSVCLTVPLCRCKKDKLQISKYLSLKYSQHISRELQIRMITVSYDITSLIPWWCPPSFAMHIVTQAL